MVEADTQSVRSKQSAVPSSVQAKFWGVGAPSEACADDLPDQVYVDVGAAQAQAAAQSKPKR